MFSFKLDHTSHTHLSQLESMVEEAVTVFSFDTRINSELVSIWAILKSNEAGRPCAPIYIIVHVPVGKLHIYQYLTILQLISHFDVIRL